MPVWGLAFLFPWRSPSGFWLATVLTGAKIPVDAPLQLLSVPEDAVFSALAALGYLFLFNVPGRIAWACVVCGVASHTTQTCVYAPGTRHFERNLNRRLGGGFPRPGVRPAFPRSRGRVAFPGVVAMIPGAFAFRVVIGCLQIVEAGAAAATAVVTETLALSVSCLLMVAAIAVGIAAPLILTKKGTKEWSAPARVAR